MAEKNISPFEIIFQALEIIILCLEEIRLEQKEESTKVQVSFHER